MTRDTAQPDADPIPPGDRCRVCRYDLRGSDTPFCPECGAPRRWQALEFYSLDAYQQASVALGDAGVPVDLLDPGLGREGMLSMVMGGMQVYRIHIPVRAHHEAREALRPLGIDVPVPLIDRAQPYCPSCGVRIHDHDASVCAGCGMELTWIDQADLPTAEEALSDVEAVLDADRNDPHDADTIERRYRMVLPFLAVIWIGFGTLILVHMILWSLVAMPEHLRTQASLLVWIGLSTAYLLRRFTRRTPS